jgi:hypothetical protein
VQAPSTIALVVLLGMALVPSSAAAQRCSGEDVAAVDQYCELIAGAEGKVPVSRATQRLRDVLPTPTHRLLLAGGVEGRALLALPVGAPLRPGTHSLDPLPGATAALAGRLGELTSSAGAAARIVGTVTDDGNGLSDAFRWALLLSTLGLAGAARVKQRD